MGYIAVTTTFHRFSSVAKINRFLHITGVRENGYHELQTIFQFLDVGDYLDFRVNNSGVIKLLTPIAGVDNSSNLIVKAAKALQKYSGCSLGVDIKLIKNLPMGGGLGGGSSNAATTLLVLNQLWQVNVTTEVLADLGLSLGADVPVFVRGCSAFAQGVGEDLTPIDVDTPWFLVTIPNVSISTQAIFSNSDLPRNTPKINIKNININDCHNDCEALVIKLYPEVAKLMAWLLEYAPSRLTGTGACIFSTFSDKKAAEYVQTLLPNDIKSFVARGLNQLPTIAELKNI